MALTEGSTGTTQLKTHFAVVMVHNLLSEELLLTLKSSSMKKVNFSFQSGVSSRETCM